MKTPNIAQMRFQLQNKPVHLAIGGQGPKNWVKGSIEPVIYPLLSTGIINNVPIPYGKKFDEARDKRIAELRNTASQPGYTGGAAKVAQHLEEDAKNPRHKQVALNNWIQGNLANYIRKQMATHEDPVRKLAEQGIVHMPPEQMGYGVTQAEAVRKKLKAPRLGQSPEAQAWEDATDVSMYHTAAGDYMNTPREPWMEKADPETRVFRPTDNMHAHYLGFDHILDVLRQDLAEGKIRPEQLSKISMEQAVRRVHQYDQERKKAMAEAVLKATEGMPVHKEYPEGYKWIEIAPYAIDENNPLPEGYSWKEPKAGVERLQGPERVYLGNTKTEALKAAHQKDSNLAEKREKPVRDALKYEGDTMGHCVGNYPDKVMRGESRIFSLRDAKNEPHVTIEVKPTPQRDLNMSGQQYDQLLTDYAAAVRRGEVNPDKLDAKSWYLAEGEARPPRITQIKGKSNLKPKPEYIPYVQDFVKSGKWSDVGDIKNADMRRTRDAWNDLELQKIRAAGHEVPEYLSHDEIKALGDKVWPGLWGDTKYAKGGLIRMADGGQPNLDTMRLALIKNGMYSPLEKAAMDVPRTKGTPQEFMSEVSKQPGFRKEELEDRQLNLPAAKMTKEDFLKHLMANRAPQVIKHELGGDRLAKIRDRMAKELVGEDYEGLNSMEQQEVDQDIRRQYGEIIPKYQEYSLPGGENYREVLLTKAPSEAEDKLRKFQAQMKNRYQFLQGPWTRHATPEEHSMAGELGKAVINEPSYKSSHWDAPNVLAHMRLSDRTGSNGEKLLHLEELQSDWHQEGRKKGYQEGKEPFDPMKAQRIKDKIFERFDAGEIDREQRNALLDQLGEWQENGRRVPNAPFKKSWHELALKHALHEAATKGYHGMVITPGEEQASRYDLSKKVEAIRANLNPDGTYQIGIRPIGKNMQHHETAVSPDKLDAMVGKELAEKIRSGVTEPGVDSGKVFSGLDLQVGGEGMKGFYDKILPDYLNKLGKKHGAQVGQVDMRVGSPDETKPLHYFPITDSLRQQIKQEGLPLYKAGGSI